MTIQKGKEYVKPFEDSGDPYLVVHFSRDDDYFMGYSSHMDSMDALLVITNLIEQHGLDAEVIAAMQQKGSTVAARELHNPPLCKTS